MALCHLVGLADNGESKVRIKSITITNIGGVSNLEVTFDKSMNIICGPNGVGKTTILECVAHSFAAYGHSILKRSANSTSGKFVTKIALGDTSEFDVSVNISEFVANGSGVNFGGRADMSKYLLSLKAIRTISYKSLGSVSVDVEKASQHTQQEALNGSNISETKAWFVHRVLWSGHEGSLSKEQIYNLSRIQGFFSLLDSSVKFNRVLASSNDIMISTSAGEIYYEYLSSGFKACLALLFGIAKDIEFRFKDPNIKIDEFDGVVLVDEIELHLHPAWQSKVPELLRKAFPKAQFIVTTHSPHVIQAAQPSEVIALEVSDGNVHVRPLPSSEFGFQGWTVEEVLSDVMGMEDTRTPLYHKLLSGFEGAIEEEDYEVARGFYNKIDALLHPENHLRKLLKFQLAAVKV
ncbi:AAA family ATPase [Pseudomonas sp. 24 R 17]|uniref:AAA family ATPase n=1 Tax=Pseudomonas sp. 24 R 17 TaxID=1844096 RepID=UPI003531FC6F